MAARVLLGVLSGSRERRRMGGLGSTPGVRVVYVTNASDDGEARSRVATDRFLWAVDGLPALRKQCAFLERAAEEDAPAVALAEDDAFVNVPMLAAVAARLLRAFGADAAWHAGSYEWYNYQPNIFRATGFGGADRPSSARYWGQRFANCSGAAFDPVRDPERRCVGPLMFPKGPLHLMSRGAARRLHTSGALNGARRRAAATAAAGRRGPNDVEFGFELVEATGAGLPLHYVSVAELGWIDRRGGGPWTAALRSDQLLAAHRLPFACWPEAERAVREEVFAEHHFELTAARSPIDTSTLEPQHWLHPPSATLRTIRRSQWAPAMRAKRIACAGAEAEAVVGGDLWLAGAGPR